VTDKNLEVFQDLNLRTGSADVSIREAILSEVRPPWRHDAERERSVKNVALKGKDVVALVRESFEGIDESGLVLWQADDGYRVANIVPRNVNELGITKYNAILQDFVRRIADPAARAAGFRIELSSERQTLEDWLEPGPVASLRRFSNLANKSTGASHPRDEARWFEFLIEAHRTMARLDAGQLSRWLFEVERWPGLELDPLARTGWDLILKSGR
jgi:hypothetical protein